MARIPREEHEAIRRRVDTDGEKVADIAATYSCTPANIYAILAKVRRQGEPASRGPAVSERPAGPVPSPAPVLSTPKDLFEAQREAPRTNALAAATAAPPTAEPATRPAKAAPELTASSGALPPIPKAPVAARPAVAASKAAAPPSKGQVRKPGYALLMRSSDGEEAVNPFRSLDELFSAAKPILRTAALSPEPVWFSIQQVDLDTLDDEA